MAGADHRNALDRDGLLAEIWYGRHPLGLVLAPVSWLWCAAALARRGAFRAGLLPVHRSAVPVIVVGNISVGGTGKTPLVVWIARLLRAHDFRPGIVCRGYGGAAARWPQQVRADSDPRTVGDEPVVLARRSGCPVAAGPDRVEAVRQHLAHSDCDVVVSDDGLQHLRLARDVEIAVIDGVRRHGNRRCLPAGPLREPLRRLRGVDLLVCNGATGPGEFGMRLVPGDLRRVSDDAAGGPLEELRGRRVHAVCGIGNPDRFFALLRQSGIDVISHRFPDHHPFARGELDFGGDLPVLMTEKDAVKCARFAAAGWWYVPVEADLPLEFGERLLARLARS